MTKNLTFWTKTTMFLLYCFQNGGRTHWLLNTQGKISQQTNETCACALLRLQSE